MNQKLKPLFMVAIPEVIFGTLVYLGFFFKFLHIPLGNLTLTLGLLTLGGSYMILGTVLFSNMDPKQLFKSPKGNTYVILKICFGLIAGFVMAIVAIGYWGLMLRLPWGAMATWIGLGFFGLLTLASLGISVKYRRFLLTYLRLFISLFMLSAPFLIFWIIFRA